MGKVKTTIIAAIIIVVAAATAILTILPQLMPQAPPENLPEQPPVGPPPENQPPENQPQEDELKGENQSQEDHTGFVQSGIISGPSPEDNYPGFNDDMFRSLTISPTDPNLIYVGSEGNGVFKSIDGGTTWAWLRNGLLYDLTEPPAYAETYDIAIDPTNNNVVYLATTNGAGPVTGEYPSSDAGVYKTTNGGESWMRKINGLKNGAVTSIVIDSSSNFTLYIGVDGGIPSFTGFGVENQLFEGGIYKSANAGENWTKLTLPEPSEWSGFWQVIMRFGTIFTLGQNWEDPARAVGLLKSSDGGTTWAKISDPPGANLHYFDVGHQNTNLIYGMDWRQNLLYKTTDGGSSWTSVSAYGVVKISPTDDQTVLFSYRHKLYKSTDGVQTWTQVMEIEGDINDIEFAPSNPNTIYVGATGLLIYKSADGGNTFVQVANLREFINAYP